MRVHNRVFSISDLEFLQGATVKVLVSSAKGEIDLNAEARRELSRRGLDQQGNWVGFERARQELYREDRNENGN